LLFRNVFPLFAALCQSRKEEPGRKSRKIETIGPTGKKTCVEVYKKGKKDNGGKKRDAHKIHKAENQQTIKERGEQQTDTLNDPSTRFGSKPNSKTNKYSHVRK